MKYLQWAINLSLIFILLVFYYFVTGLSPAQPCNKVTSDLQNTLKAVIPLNILLLVFLSVINYFFEKNAGKNYWRTFIILFCILNIGTAIILYHYYSNCFIPASQQ